MTRAFKDSPAVFLKLSMYDSDWLKVFNQRHKDRGYGARSSEKWLVKANASLKSANASLLALDIPVQITWTKLTEVAGLKSSGISANRPEIAALRKKLCESVTEFRDRALNIWFSRLANNRPKTPAQFVEMSGLRKLSPAQTMRLEAWLKRPS